MQNKLQELTDKLYKEGLSKGQGEAETIVANAKAEAKKILDDAKHEAESIINRAGKSADEAKKNADAEISMVSKQVIAQVKQSVESLITAKIITPTTKAAINDVAFVQTLVKTAVENFKTDSENAAELSVLLPESKQKEFEQFINEAATKQLGDDKVEYVFSNRIKSGFRIVSKGSGYYISFTEQDFLNLFSEYTRPKMRQLLFGQE
jgi:V/A-type H+-transporting ATPase subunit E